jgi:tetratricopeptide (TPR) repeat protein
MKSITSIFACILLLSTPLFAQKPALETWGCPEKDYKCQLDVRMKALQADPKNPENYYNLGVVFQRSGNHAQAVESFSMYVSIPGLKPELQADGYNNRGISHRALRKLDLALADYSKANELDPKNPRFLVNRGNVNRDMRKADAALEDYAAALKVDPQFALAYSNRGHFWLESGKNEEAIKDLSKAIELDATNAEPFYSRAMAYRATRQFAKAIPDLDKYIALDPGNDKYLADGYLNRGIAHAVTGKPEQAEKDVSKAIALAPTYVDAYRVRAVVYRDLKKPELAEADEKKAAELTTGGTLPATADTAKTSMEYLAEGSKYYMAGDYKRAIGPYQKALDLEKQQQKLPRNLWIVLLDNLGMAYGITGDIKASFGVFEYGIGKEPTYPLFYYNMACGYGELGDEDNAIKYLRLAFKHRSNVLEGTRFPNPETDSSFAKFRNSDKFKKALKEM